MNWQVYIIRCSDGSLYTGITTDVLRRMKQHAARRGARYFRARHPRQLVYLECGHDRASASRREAAIKALTRSAKEALILSGRNEVAGSGQGAVRSDSSD